MKSPPLSRQYRICIFYTDETLNLPPSPSHSTGYKYKLIDFFFIYITSFWDFLAINPAGVTRRALGSRVIYPFTHTDIKYNTKGPLNTVFNINQFGTQGLMQAIHPDYIADAYLPNLSYRSLRLHIVVALSTTFLINKNNIISPHLYKALARGFY